jgi:hypothetical protein
MEPWQIAIVLKPFVLLALSVLAALLAMWIAPYIPATLSDRTFRSRHPVIFSTIAIGSWVAFIGWFITAASQ